LRDEVFDMMESLWLSSNNITNSNNSTREFGRDRSLTRTGNLEKEDIVDAEALTQSNWDLLLQGAKIQKYKKENAIIREGENFQRIYQMISGQCRIEKGNKCLGVMYAGQMFGEISFLVSGGATASVIADSDEVEIYVLEGYYINILFAMRPELAGKFYKHLASCLQRTIRSREEAWRR
jgi:CRP-like cAMP-binding protein